MNKESYNFYDLIEDLSVIEPVDLVSGDTPLPKVIKFCIDTVTVLRRGKDIEMTDEQLEIIASCLSAIGCVKSSEVSPIYRALSHYEGLTLGALSKMMGTIDYPLEIFDKFLSQNPLHIDYLMEYILDSKGLDDWIHAQTYIMSNGNVM